MITNVLLLTPSEIKTNSRIEIAVDDKTLRDLILVSQDSNLSNVLGETLYQELLQAVVDNNTNSTPIPDKFTNLMPYIRKYMTYQIISDFIKVNNYKMTNKGINKLTDPNAETATNSDLDWYGSYYLNATSSYKKRLVDYLKDNNLTYSTDTIDNEASYRGIYMNYDENNLDYDY